MQSNKFSIVAELQHGQYAIKQAHLRSNENEVVVFDSIGDICIWDIRNMAKQKSLSAPALSTYQNVLFHPSTPFIATYV